MSLGSTTAGAVAEWRMHAGDLWGEAWLLVIAAASSRIFTEPVLNFALFASLTI